MAKTKLAVCTLATIACFGLQSSDASICKPYSKFKVDCNTCTCSSNGKEFSCTDIICEPVVYKDKYLIEQDKKGYSILKPKDNDRTLSRNNDLFTDDSITNKASFRRDQRYIGKPMVNDGRGADNFLDYGNDNGEAWPEDARGDEYSSENEDNDNNSDESDTANEEGNIGYSILKPKDDSRILSRNNDLLTDDSIANKASFRRDQRKINKPLVNDGGVADNFLEYENKNTGARPDDDRVDEDTSENEDGDDNSNNLDTRNKRYEYVDRYVDDK